MKQELIKLGQALFLGTAYANAIFIATGTTLYIQNKIWIKMGLLK